MHRTSSRQTKSIGDGGVERIGRRDREHRPVKTDRQGVVLIDRRRRQLSDDIGTRLDLLDLHVLKPKHTTDLLEKQRLLLAAELENAFQQRHARIRRQPVLDTLQRGIRIDACRAQKPFSQSGDLFHFSELCQQGARLTRYPAAASPFVSISQPPHSCWRAYARDRGTGQRQQQRSPRSPSPAAASRPRTAQGFRRPFPPPRRQDRRRAK